MMKQRMTIKVSTGTADPGEVESFCTQGQPPPQVRHFVSLATTTNCGRDHLTKYFRKVDRFMAVHI